MHLGLKAKKILITGASRGIGLAIAERFLKEGAHVVIVSRGSSNLYKAEEILKKAYKNSKIKAEECDCTNQESLSDLKDRVTKMFGNLDVVVANIGDGRGVTNPLPDDEQWKEGWSANFESALYTARTFLPTLQESKGCLLFVSSIAALETIGAPVDYSTAKTAVISLAKNMAKKLGNEVRVNVVAPGNILFDGSSWDIKLKQSPREVETIIQSTVPMNRFGLPEEVANAVVFLCSDKASFITGSTLVIDGGQTVGII